MELNNKFLIYKKIFQIIRRTVVVDDEEAEFQHLAALITAAELGHKVCNSFITYDQYEQPPNRQMRLVYNVSI